MDSDPIFEPADHKPQLPTVTKLEDQLAVLHLGSDVVQPVKVGRRPTGALEQLELTTCHGTRVVTKPVHLTCPGEPHRTRTVGSMGSPRQDPETPPTPDL